MARALRAWAINRGGKSSVRNLRYGPRTRLVRGICLISGILLESINQSINQSITLLMCLLDLAYIYVN